MLSGRGLCDELITRPEESYRLCCVVVRDLETSRIGALYVYDISSLRVKPPKILWSQDMYELWITNVYNKYRILNISVVKFTMKIKRIMNKN